MLGFLLSWLMICIIQPTQIHLSRPVKAETQILWQQRFIQLHLRLWKTLQCQRVDIETAKPST